MAGGKDDRLALSELPEPIFDSWKQEISIFKLDKDNYSMWKRHVMTVFDLKGISKYLKTSCASNEKGELLARSLILSSVSQKWMADINGCKTAYDMWQRLADINGEQVEASLMSTIRQFYSMKHHGMDMSTHIGIMETMRQQLESMGEPVSDRTFCGILLNSLKSGYEILQQTWDMTPAAEKTPSKLISKLLALHSQIQEAERTEVALVARGRMSIEERKKNSTCAKCGHKGHWAKECRTKPENYNLSKVARCNYAL